MCLERGAYMANMAKCGGCGGMQLREEAVQPEAGEGEEREGAEVVSYQHICTSCSHVVCAHKYEFWLEEGRQEYRMDCLLCGFAEDSVSCLPTDPRKAGAMEL
jgi:hypothetical protein